VLDDYTLGSDLDRQFGDLPVGLRKILLSMIHGFADTPVSRHFKLKRWNNAPNTSVRSPTQQHHSSICET
jgi:hypothetical protein